MFCRKKHCRKTVHNVDISQQCHIVKQWLYTVKTDGVECQSLTLSNNGTKKLDKLNETI